MSLSGVMSSPYQRKFFLFSSILIIIVSCFIVWILYWFTLDTRGWNLLISVLVSIVTSAIFSLGSALYLAFFFEDPFELASAQELLPQDVGQALRQIAENTADYKLFVRTGRHFRAEILPVLVNSAIKSRRPVQIEVVLLNFRNDALCEKYAAYRKSTSFDAKVWTTEYVQQEVLATISRLIDTVVTHSSLVKVDLYLSDRLSIFRIDGSSDELIVTREDPKDTASRYRRDDRTYSAFLTEFNWTRDDAIKVRPGSNGLSLPTTLEEMLDGSSLLATVGAGAAKAKTAPSPYAR